MNLIKSLVARAECLGRRRRNSMLAAKAEAYISGNRGLAEAVRLAKASSKSTGVSDLDFATMHHLVTTWGARTVLECGTGKSTFVLAEALKQIGGTVRLVSMEEEAEWAAHANSVFPFARYPFVEIIHSPVVEWGYSYIRGNIYRDVPAADYDFVFVDGPVQMIGGIRSSDMDFVRLVSQSERPIGAMIDDRKYVCASYANLFPDHLKVHPGGIGIVRPVTRHDIALKDKESLTRLTFARFVKISTESPLDLE